ncbi:hypothetical protein KEM48_001300 [Puccinia striiformis f. sp. tritici PST-130]|nr:hypothetical protein KEM48_001300 [Puccinia striiformis f. sp. tritici PST-130]
MTLCFCHQPTSRCQLLVGEQPPYVPTSTSQLLADKQRPYVSITSQLLVGEQPPYVSVTSQLLVGEQQPYVSITSQLLVDEQPPYVSVTSQLLVGEQPPYVPTGTSSPATTGTVRTSNVLHCETTRDTDTRLRSRNSRTKRWGSTDIISSNDVIGSPLSPLPIRTGHCLTPPHSPSAPEIAPPPPQLHNLPGLISLLPNSHHGTNQQETT